MPCTRPGALSTVTTVTPVANWPRARRKSSEVSGTDDMGFSEDITGEEQTVKHGANVGRPLKVKRSGFYRRSFLWTDTFCVSVKVDGPYFPCCCPSLAAAAWHYLAAASAAVVVFELPFARSAAVFAAAAAAVVFGFAAGVARSLFVAPFFAAAVAAGAASLAAALLADRRWVALPTDVRSAHGWLDDSHLD